MNEYPVTLILTVQLEDGSTQDMKLQLDESAAEVFDRMIVQKQAPLLITKIKQERVEYGGDGATRTGCLVEFKNTADPVELNLPLPYDLTWRAKIR